jgi:hypothetical protein
MFRHQGRRFTSALAVLLLGLTCFAPTRGSAEPASAASPQPAAAAPHYFVEFRVGTIGTYGHSYAVYGSGSRVRYTDLHPVGNYALMAVGHVLPVPANTEWDPRVLALPIASRYRVDLTPARYAQLLAAVAKAKANKSPTWNAITNNCNHFIGELAEAIGLKVPGSFLVSYAFVPAMKQLNADAPRDGAPAGKVSSKKVAHVSSN